tara:strand:+ start:5452 stop:5907 length:456 start_codon:yes stop_codon:yes gene_type:complete
MSKDNIYMKCKCKNIIPKARLSLGYTTCVECSTVERYGCIDTINHKTGNSIQVMSRSDAAKASKLLQRAGYSTLRALSGKSVTKKRKIGNGCRLTNVGSQQLYEQVGKTYVDYYDIDQDLAARYLQRALDNYEISQLQYNTIVKLTKLITN